MERKQIKERQKEGIELEPVILEVESFFEKNLIIYVTSFCILLI